LNKTLCEKAPMQLATAVYVMNGTARIGKYSAADHPPPMI
jgi:hypothetical protein